MSESKGIGNLHLDRDPRGREHHHRSRLLDQLVNMTSPNENYLTGVVAGTDGLWSLNVADGCFSVDPMLAFMFHQDYQPRFWAGEQAQDDVAFGAFYQHLRQFVAQAKETGDVICNTGWNIPSPRGAAAQSIHIRGVFGSGQIISGVARWNAQFEDAALPEAPELTIEALQLALNAGRDLISISSPTGKILYISESIERLYGYKQEEMGAAGTLDFVHPEDVSETMRLMDQLSAGNDGSIIVRVRHRDGRWIWVECYARPCELANGDRILVVHQWIIDHLKNEMESGQRQRAELENTLGKRTTALKQAREAMQGVISAARGIMQGLGGEDMKGVVAPVRDRIASTLAYEENDPDRLREALRQAHDALDIVITGDFTTKEYGRYPGLSPREAEVADLIVEGLVSKQIAVRLGVTTDSINVHRKSIRKKLGISGRDRRLDGVLRAIKDHETG